MIGDELVDDEDVRELLMIVGEQLAKWREHEAYERAGVRAGSIAAKPWAQVINHLWVTYAPGFLAEMTSSVPGLGKALIMSAIAFGPAAMSDLASSREKRAARARPTGETGIPGPTIEGNVSRIRPGRQNGSVRETE